MSLLFVTRVLSSALLVGCLDTAAPLQPLPPGGHHVLFVGNSLTDANDLPGTLVGLAASVGDTIRTASVTAANYGLIDHLNDGRVQGVIGQGGWEYVILQQGPSTVPVNRDSLVIWTRMFDPLVRSAGARTGLFMVWPDVTRLAFFDDCRLAYQQAAQAVNGVFRGAGVAHRVGGRFHAATLRTRRIPSLRTRYLCCRARDVRKDHGSRCAQAGPAGRRRRSDTFRECRHRPTGPGGGAPDEPAVSLISLREQCSPLRKPDTCLEINSLAGRS